MIKLKNLRNPHNLRELIFSPADFADKADYYFIMKNTDFHR